MVLARGYLEKYCIFTYVAASRMHEAIRAGVVFGQQRTADNICVHKFEVGCGTSGVLGRPDGVRVECNVRNPCAHEHPESGGVTNKDKRTRVTIERRCQRVARA